MLARLRSIWFSIKASYWLYPSLFAICGFALAQALVHFDRTGAAEWLAQSGFIHPARPDGASNILTVLAGSMIGVASTVFSITIAAVAYASGTYGPRLLTNFMEDKGNQLSLATFIGTFVYALTVLRTVRSEDEAPLFAAAADNAPGFVPQLSLFVAFGLMIVSVGVLVYFLHHIPASIRINTVLEGIAKPLLLMIERHFPERFDGIATTRIRPQGASINASATGYIRVIDYGQLVDLATEGNLRIALDVRAGDFLHPGKPLATTDRVDLDDALADDVRNCFALGGSRTPEQDIEFSIDELVEIALRALSPGINDPFTAITAVHWLGAATARLGERDLRQHHHGLHEGEDNVIPLADDFDHFLARGFGAARGALASNRLVALVALDTLGSALLTIRSQERRGLLVDEAARLLTQASLSLTGPDLEEVTRRHEAFRDALAEADRSEPPVA